MPKTLTDAEITDLITRELREYRHDCGLRTRVYSNAEAASLIFGALDEDGLIARDSPHWSSQGDTEYLIETELKLSRQSSRTIEHAATAIFHKLDETGLIERTP